MLTVLENDEVRIVVRTSGLNHQIRCFRKETGAVIMFKQLNDIPLIRIITEFQNNGFMVTSSKTINNN